jgi:hypothetical protein
VLERKTPSDSWSVGAGLGLAWYLGLNSSPTFQLSLLLRYTPTRCKFCMRVSAMDVNSANVPSINPESCKQFC